MLVRICVVRRSAETVIGPAASGTFKVADRTPVSGKPLTGFLVPHTRIRQQRRRKLCWTGTLSGR